MSPWPQVKGKPRSRNKNGSIRKKRSDVGKLRLNKTDRKIKYGFSWLFKH